MDMGHWILVDREPVKCTLLEWGAWFETNERIIEHTDIDDVRISTVFLGIDHSFSFDPGGPPILFETMIFGGDHDQYQTRCATYDEAKKMHTKALWLVRGAEEVEDQAG